MTATIAPEQRLGGSVGFGQVLHAEWTKFRTVRGWVIGVVVAALVTVGIALLDHSECGGEVTPGGVPQVGCPAPPAGPGGEAVTDSFYFVHQPLAAGGEVTARVVSLAGDTEPWAKAGIIIKASTRPGSAYAAVMVTGGHGTRMQDDYTGDIAGPVNARWLRLARSGDTVTGYASADGAHWSAVGTARLAGLPATAQAGLFVAAPGSARPVSRSLGGGTAAGGIALAAARFDHVGLAGARPGGSWAGVDVGGRDVAPGTGFRLAGDAITVSGSGDIAPDVPGTAGGGGDATPVERTLTGAFGGLIAVIVVAVMFMTAEYRRGVVRVTFAAVPRRATVLAAKAVVIGSVAFAAGLAGAAAAVPLGERVLRSNGNQMLPVGTLTELRVVAGTAALLAVAAVLALAVGTIVRQGAIAVTAVIVAIVLPYFFAVPLSVLPAGASGVLLRVTPAAAFAIQQSVPRYPQVSADYTPMNGYFPLGPWAGFAVLCGYAALALAVAVFVLRRRDA